MKREPSRSRTSGPEQRGDMTGSSNRRRVFPRGSREYDHEEDLDRLDPHLLRHGLLSPWISSDLSRIEPPMSSTPNRSRWNSIESRAGRVRMEKCPRCGGTYVRVHVEQKGPHLGIYCSTYGHWIRWARKEDEEHVE